MKYFAFILLFCSFLNAHKVNLFITDKEGAIDIYSYFANGKACKNCKLIIKNDSNTILEDKLDTNGEYLYKSNYKSLEVVIDAGEGHIAKESVEVKNIKVQDINTHKKDEKRIELMKIVFGIFSIFIVFYLLKRFKK